MLPRVLLLVPILTLACTRDPAAPSPAPTPNATPAAATPGRPLPPPIENWLDQDAEERNSAARKDWKRRMHRAPPGVDTEAADQANGLAAVARHRRLAVSPPVKTSGRWVERGSSNQAGRMHVSRWSTDGTQLYAGSSFGGLWRGNLDGTDWEPLGDDTYGGAHFLEVMPSTTDGYPEVLVTATDGGIVLRSVDAGVTWTAATDLGSPWWTRRMLQTSDGSHTLFLLQASNAGVKLYRSTDRGASWAEIHDLAGYYGDIWSPRDGDGTLYLLDGAILKASTDMGDSWVDVGTIPSASGTGDLVGSEAGAPTFYAVLDGRILWRSPDGGESWESVAPIGDYWGGSLNASTVDPDFFVYGGVEVHKSRDAGTSFTTQNGWGDYYGDPANLLHADVPGIDVFPDGAGGEIWYINTDGGTYHSVDGLASTQNLSLSGLRVGQYYDVLTSSADPTHIAIGAQDQGYQVTNDVAQDDDLYEADQILSGDYGHLTSGDGTHAYVYSVYPGFILVQQGETSPTLDYLDFPSGETYVPWLPPIMADPDDPTSFYFPATTIYKYTKGRRTWEYALYSEQDFRVAGDEYVSRLAFSPVDHTRAWAATSYGRVWYSSDKGVTWTRSTSMVADENWYYGQAIAPSLTDRNVVTIGGSGYGVPAVYRSGDGGVTFRPWSEGLPDTLVYTLVEAPDGSGTLFAGTQTGAYRRDPGAAEWVDITGAEAPITTYWDAEGLAHENTIRFATYGRGVWDYQIGVTEGGCWPVADGDGDGVNCDTDCDDADNTVYPGATEACDGRDVDCDPLTPLETDGDGDGALACADCNDADPVRFPGATELCGDGIDEDCDGVDPACDPATPDPDGNEDPEKDGGGCGCSSPTGAAAPALVGVALALTTLRRRRRA